MLGRALVEPTVSDSRLGEDRPEQTSAVQSTTGGAKRPSKRRAQRRRLGERARAEAVGADDGADDGARERASDGASDGDAPAERSGDEDFEEAAEEAAAKAAAVRAASTAKRAVADADADGARRFSGLVLRHYWDLEPLCERFDLVPRSLYNRLKRGGHVVIAPREGNRGIGLWRLHSKQAVQRAFRPVASSKTIEIRGMWRSVTNSEALRIGQALPYKGVSLRPSTWELNPGYELIAIQLIAGLMDPQAGGRFLAVQWRSEDWQKQVRSYGGDPSAPDALHACARWAAAHIREEMAARNLTEAYLATDLREGASGTYAVGVAQAEALRLLYQAVPRLNNPRLRAFIDAIPDAGVRANVETAVCLKATVLLATTGHCRDCAHAKRCAKMSSAFGHYIVERRQAFMRPTQPLF